MQSKWRVGSLFGIPLFLDSSWFLILLLVTFLYGSNPNWQTAWGSGGAWVAGFVLALLLFVSVLLHELGHSLAALSQGISVNSITLFLFGGIASIDKESKTPGAAFQVAIAGPLVSFGIYLTLSLLLATGTVAEIPYAILYNIAQTNLVLALFNLIPGLPLDGGQVLKAAVWKITGKRVQGVRWAARSGLLLGWTAIVLGVVAYLSSQRLDLLWIALLGWFAVRNANAYNRVTDLQEALSSLKAEDAAVRDFRVLDARMSLRQFADDYGLIGSSERSDSSTAAERPTAYFAASDGRYRGEVALRDLQTIERSTWESRDLHSIARPLTEIPTVKESDPLTTVIESLEAQQLGHITVLTPADAVAGTIDRGDIVRALAQKMNLPVSEALIERIKASGAYPSELQLAAIAKAAAE